MMELKLREIRRSDSNRYFKWINDRELVLNNAPYSPISELDHERWFETVSKSDQIRIFSIVVVENEIETLIGSCSLRNLDLINRSAELQIRIGEEKYRGNGWGSRAVAALIDFGFRDLNLNRIYLEVFGFNKRAIRVYQKCGFVQEGVKKEGVYINGEYQDIVIMAIIRGKATQAS